MNFKFLSVDSNRIQQLLELVNFKLVKVILTVYYKSETHKLEAKLFGQFPFLLFETIYN